MRKVPAAPALLLLLSIAINPRSLTAADPQPAPAAKPAPAATPAAPPGPTRNIGGPGDYGMREKLIHRLTQDPDLSRTGLKLVLVNGGAVFSGTAATWTLKRRALALAGGSRGIINVTDQVTVPRGQVKDEEILAAITGLFKERKETLGIESFEIQVQDSVVTLLGEVKDFPSRVHTEETAGTVMGVTRIVDRMRPRSAPSGTDDASVRKAIVSYLTDYREYPYDGTIEVQVRDGKVRLTGGVGLFLARQQAGTMTALVGGVREVDNRIKVDPAVRLTKAFVTEIP